MTDEERSALLKPKEPIAIVRLNDLSKATDISRAMLEGGLRNLEFTLTNERAFEAIGEVREVLDDEIVVGAGTVLSAENARRAIEFGAQFLVTPVLRRDVIESAGELDVPVVCGAFSPTEIMDAWQFGADMVKVFPARSLGPSYVKDILAPLPELRLIPTGGVGLENCADFIEAGAYTVAIGSNLVSEEAVSSGDWRALSQEAAKYARECQNAG